MNLVFDLKAVQKLLGVRGDVLDRLAITLDAMAQASGSATRIHVLLGADESFPALRHALRRHAPSIRCVATGPVGPCEGGEDRDKTDWGQAMDAFACGRLRADLVHSFFLEDAHGDIHGRWLGDDVRLRTCTILREGTPGDAGVGSVLEETTGVVSRTSAVELAGQADPRAWLKDISRMPLHEGEAGRPLAMLACVRAVMASHAQDNAMQSSETGAPAAAGPVAWFPSALEGDPPEGDVTAFTDDPSRQGSNARPVTSYASCIDAFDLTVVDMHDTPAIQAALQPLSAGVATVLRLHGDKHALSLAPAVLKQGRDGQRLLALMLYALGGYDAVSRAVRSGWNEQDVGALWSERVAHGLRRFEDMGPSPVLASGIPDDAHDREAFHAVVAGAAGGQALSDEVLACLARAYSATVREVRGEHRLLVDVSVVSVDDAGTGIQRVVHNIARQLIAAPPTGFRLEFVRVDELGRLLHARDFASRRYLDGAALPPDDIVEPSAGDVFFGLDLSTWQINLHRDTYERMRDAGVEMHFLVHDLLPLTRPDYFQAEALLPCRRWYQATAELADGIVCVSHATARDYLRWLKTYRPVRSKPIRLGVAYPGVDFDHYHLDGAVRVARKASRGEREASFLMVGTVEPRKGHAQALDAFGVLWDKGRDVELTIIGRQGWMTDDLAARIREHPEHGKRLHWLHNAGDDVLKSRYESCSAVIMASEAEGFGLPIIEAGLFEVPIILRDIPVFREVAGEHGFYFCGFTGKALADALECWMQGYRDGTLPSLREAGWRDWAACRDDLEALMFEHDGWDHVWKDDGSLVLPYYAYTDLPSVGVLSHERMVTSGTSGQLIGGLQRHMASGAYIMELYGEYAGEGHCRVELLSEGGGVTMVREELGAQAGEGPGHALMRRRVEVQTPRLVDFRIYVDGACDLAFDRVEFHREAQGDAGRDG